MTLKMKTIYLTICSQAKVMQKTIRMLSTYKREHAEETMVTQYERIAETLKPRLLFSCCQYHEGLKQWNMKSVSLQEYPRRSNYTL